MTTLIVTEENNKVCLDLFVINIKQSSKSPKIYYIAKQ